MGRPKSTDGEKKTRTPKSAEQTVAAAKKSVSRAAASVMQLHLKALNTDGLEPIASAAKALVAALIAPPVEK